MRHIKLLIEYDGSNYHGWQSQKSGGTIQDIIRNRIEDITGENIRLTGASRTDSGVHALGQVAVFGTGSDLPAAVFLRALNAKLPKDIRVLHSEETVSNFHPRYQAQKKRYFYIISECKKISAFYSRYVWDINTKLDLPGILEAVPLLLGEHDFRSFMGSGCSSKNQIRTIFSLEVSRLKEIIFMTSSFRGDYIKIQIEANAFLRHMVRNIVGTLVEIGRARISPDSLKHIVDSRDRNLAGPTAPAQGLFLEKIIY